MMTLGQIGTMGKELTRFLGLFEGCFRSQPGFALGREIDTTYYDNGLVHTKVWKDASGTTVNTQTFTYRSSAATKKELDGRRTASIGMDVL